MFKTTLLIALLAATAPVSAQPHSAAAAMARVPIADLNLANASGAAELDRRIGKAVKSVCPEPQSRDLERTLASKACRLNATRAAAAQRDAVLAAGRNERVIRIVAAR